MKLIMERFEKFSKKTIQEQSEAQMLNEQQGMPKFGLLANSAISKVKAVFGSGMRFGQMMDDDVKKHKDFARYFQQDFGLAMQMAEKAAFKTPYAGTLKPKQIAKLATDDFFNSFRTKSPHYNKGIGARGREKRLRPIILSAFTRAAMEVMGGGKPNVVPRRRSKCALNTKLLKKNPDFSVNGKLLRPIGKNPDAGSRGAWSKLKEMLQIVGVGKDLNKDDNTCNRRLIAAIIAFQKKAFPGKRREHDGLYGPKTHAKMVEMATAAAKGAKAQASDPA